MFVLITNDDGIHADGIYALTRAISSLDGVRVLVAAPERERSACGHAVTLHRPVNVQHIKIRGLEHVDTYTVSGMPADCVKLAVGALADERPDIVFSGINRGPNLATDVLCSGTVSAAIEGAIQGLPAVAVSLGGFTDLDYEPAASFAAALVRCLGSYQMPRFSILNVNVPAVSRSEIAGVRFTKMGIAQATDQFEGRTDPWGRTYYWLQAETIVDDWDKDSDMKAVQDNMISVTPLHLDLTSKSHSEIARACPLPPVPWD